MSSPQKIECLSRGKRKGGCRAAVMDVLKNNPPSEFVDKDKAIVLDRIVGLMEYPASVLYDAKDVEDALGYLHYSEHTVWAGTYDSLKDHVKRYKVVLLPRN